MPLTSPAPSPVAPPPVPLGYQGPWTSPNGTLDLMGQPLPSDRYFFFPPPPQIGQVTNAWSTVRQGKTPWPAWLKALAVIILTVIAGLCIGLVLNGGRRDDEKRDMLMAVLVAVALVGLVFALRNRHKCMYVGTSGIARFKWGKPAGEVTAFAEADQLMTVQTRHYHNGIYTGTQFDFAWFANDARRLGRVKGTYYDRKGRAKPNTDFNYARTAELAWSEHYLHRALAQLNQQGFAQFVTTKKSSAIRVLPGAIEFLVAGEVIHLTPAEIKKLELQSGSLVVHHKDAKWYSGKGKFTFRYGGIANARVMLLLLEKLVGYRFS